MPAFARKTLSFGIAVAVLAALAGVLALALSPFGQGQAAAAGSTPYVTRYYENGDRASLWAILPEAVPGNPDSACWLNLDVSRGGTPQASQTNLDYNLSGWDPTFQWEDKEGQIHYGGCIPQGQGYGQIPNGAYRVVGQTHTLRVDTSAVPGFNLWAGSGGVITLTWQRTSEYESRHSGNDWSRSPWGSSHHSGTWSESSATAVGTVLGTSVDVQGSADPKGGANGGASVGSSSGVSVCRSSDPNICYYGGK